MSTTDRSSRCTLEFLPSTIAWVLGLALLLPANTYADELAVDFKARILPVLEDNCFQCHGPNKQQSELRVDQLASLLRGGNSGEPAILPGKSQASYLIKAITGKGGGKRMPLDMDPLTDEEIDLLSRWIDEGANWPGQTIKPGDADPQLKSDHWSLKPVTDPQAPNHAGDTWSANAIDAFILERLRKNRLEPSSPADRRTLIRRAFFTLHGLLPTPEQSTRYTNDQRADWYERMVDDLLDSPRYGERWARHWLDLIRFAQTDGFEMNQPRDNAYHYRDYVIRAFNEDKPYDQFILDQLAGDVTGEHAATGFLVAGPHDKVANSDPVASAIARENELADIVNVTSTTFLGLTVACARCHNHKFDPILATDYYALAAVFTGVYHGDRQVQQGQIDPKALAKLDQQVRDIQDQLDALEPLASADADAKDRRSPVNPGRNVDRFKPVKAQWIRFVIESTNNTAEPCLDELEIYPAEDEKDSTSNIALSASGAVASSSGDLPGYAIHQLQHINDGQYSNAKSWISSTRSGGWVQITLPEAREIDRVVWGRDRSGAYSDRLPVNYRIEVALEPGKWTVVASSRDRTASLSSLQRPEEDQAKHKQLSEQLQELHLQRNKLTNAAKQTIYAGQFKQPATTYRLYRGDPTQRREAVSPDTLAVLGRLSLKADEPEQNRRLAFAQSLTEPDHPLTARVMVNRIWQHHFGQGLVSTPSDMGHMGVPPTHPELLDYLASRFIQSRWSIKSMHRLILNSSTFKQASAPRLDAMQVDSSATLLWRFPPRRHEAEVIRDNILLVSGKLDLTLYGPGFSLFEPNNNYVRVYNPKRTFEPADFRRMVYAYNVRMERDPTFGSFDCPDAGQPTPRRPQSTTALQALGLFNSPFILEQANFLAQRLREDAGEQVKDQINLAYHLLYNRSPTEQELELGADYVREHSLALYCRVLMNTNEFLFVP